MEIFLRIISTAVPVFIISFVVLKILKSQAPDLDPPKEDSRYRSIAFKAEMASNKFRDELNQKTADLNYEIAISDAAYEMYMDWRTRKDLGRNYGLIIYPIMPGYIIHDYDTAKYKGKDIHNLVQKEFEKLKAKDEEKA